MRIAHAEEYLQTEIKHNYFDIYVAMVKVTDHQTLGGFPKVKEGSSRGFDGK